MKYTVLDLSTFSATETSSQKVEKQELHPTAIGISSKLVSLQ
jgi:hypothetical protein